jgi:methyl-accepting chemotaxis protein
MKLNLAQKVISLIVLVCIVFVGIEAYTNFTSQKELYRKTYIDKARSISYGLDANIKNRDDLKLESLSPFIQKNIWLYSDIIEIKVSKADGDKLTIIASNNPNEIGKIPDEENWKSYTDDIIIDNELTLSSVNILRVYSPIHISGKTIGTYQIDLNMHAVNKEINQQLVKTIIAYSVLLIVIISVLLLALNYILIEPLNKLISGLREISSGNMDYIISINSGDEYEEAATVFNNMAKDINRVNHELRTKKEDLEKQVIERTAELEKSKKDLELKLTELEGMNNLMVGRELKMIELKKEIDDLKKQTT